MPIPDYQTLMLPVLRLAADGETRVPIAADRIATEFGLTEEEREEFLPSQRQRRLHNRIHWAKFYMSKAGLVETPSRGRFVANEAGRALLATNPPRIDLGTLKTRPEFLEFYEASGEKPEEVSSPERPVTVTDETPEETIDGANAVLRASLKADLLQRILEQDPAFFERLIVDLLVAMGYGGTHQNAAMRLGKSGDGGIDGIIDEGPTGARQDIRSGQTICPRLFGRSSRSAGLRRQPGRPWRVQGCVRDDVKLQQPRGRVCQGISFSASSSSTANAWAT